MHPSGSYTGHKAIRSAYNRWGSLGNVDRAFVRLLNRLEQLRYPARYLERELLLDLSEAAEMVSTAEAMYETLRRRMPTRAAVNR